MREHIFLGMKKFSLKKLSLIILFMFFCFNVYAAEKYNKIYSFEIDGVITDATVKHVAANIERAERDNVPVLIYINTPGGVLESTRLVVQNILSSKVPVITYVYPNGARAASAGMFITIAGDYAVMSESTNIGAAHPVSSNGEDIKGEMEKKILNDTIALAKSIAEKRGRNEAAVTAMVEESASYTAKEALDLKIINAVSIDENILSILPDSLNISKTAEIQFFEPNFTQSLYNFIANPNILSVLLFIGIALILLEIKMAGTFIFGSLGVVCLVLFAFGANILPINLIGVGLIILGFGLLVAEVFITSFGLLTIGGIISFVFGLKALFDSEKSAGISVSMWVIILIISLCISLVLLIGRLIIKDFKRKPVVGIESLEGSTGSILEWDSAAHKGKVQVNGEIWNACSEKNYEKGDMVKVIVVDGLTLHIEKNNNE